MFDIGWPELMVIAVVALVVIGPKDLPRAVYGVGKWVRKARSVAREFQHHIDDMMREAELDEIRQQAVKVRDTNITRMVEEAVDPSGQLRSAFDPAELGKPGTPAPPSVTAAQPQPATEPPVTAPPPTVPPATVPPATATASPGATTAAPPPPDATAPAHPDKTA